jgi:hypothetical protein
VDQWLRQTADTDQPPDTTRLRRQFDAAIAELAAGLDRPSFATT